MDKGSIKKKIFRCATVHSSIDFVRGMVPYLSTHYDLVLLSSPGKYLSEMEKEFGVRVYAVPMERKIAPLKDLISLFKLIRVFHKEKPDMVHSMTPKAGLLCMTAAWITRVPVRIHTFTGLVWPTQSGMKRLLLMNTDRLTCAFATHIIPEGQGVLNDLRSNVITSKPLKVLGYGNIQGIDFEKIDRRKFLERRSELRLKYELQNSFVFVFVGRLVGDKGINELVDAFVRLNADYPDTRLILIGNREDDDMLSSRTQCLINENPHISELGVIYGDELYAHYVMSDCLAFPSYREGFPNTVLEAGALGLPCIVTDINGSREIIENGKNGLIVPPRDSSSLLCAMKYMIEKPLEVRRMASNAMDAIASRFDCRFVRQCLYDYYQEVLDN